MDETATTIVVPADDVYYYIERTSQKGTRTPAGMEDKIWKENIKTSQLDRRLMDASMPCYMFATVTTARSCIDTEGSRRTVFL
jgi:hypothetical protein